jgi:hypothetical protein
MKPSPASPDKYIDVKNKLQKLRYKLYFDISHTNIIEALITDITKYISEIEYLKNEKEQQKSIIENSQINVNAIKQENNRLIKENNQLHREIIEVSKSYNSAISSRDHEIQRQAEEKDSLKFMFLEAKRKLTNLAKENDLLKHKHSEMVTKIYDKNFNEETLRKLYSNQGRDDDSDIGVYVKRREITQNSEINLVSSEGFSHITGRAANDNSSLRELIKETFEKQPIENTSNSFYKKSEDDFFKKIGSLQNEILGLNNKINLLESEIKTKDNEIFRLNNLATVKGPFLDNNSGTNDIIIKFLKEEKETVKEKYEQRIDYLIKENKKLEDKNKKLLEQYQRLKNSAPYVNELLKENKIKTNDLTVLIKNKKELELTNKYLTETITKLKEEAKILKENSTKEKEQLVKSKQEELTTLLAENIASRELITTLDYQLKESRANSSSTNRLIYDELKYKSTKCSEMTEEKFLLVEQMNNIKQQHENCAEKINLLNQAVMLKENLIDELREKLLESVAKFDKLEDDKRQYLGSIKEINQKVESHRKELCLKDSEIERLQNMNFILQKENEIYYKKLQN